MCGIAGVFHTCRKSVDPKVLALMTKTLSHRGPDGYGIWIKDYIGLGHNRLAIRDLSDLGKQPMSSATGDITITFNGEIYNYEELRYDLENNYGIAFRSRCDTELIPAGYLAWGVNFFSKIEGIFAIGLWDSRNHRLILARDAIGVKPLFYSKSGKTFRFASEVKGILADTSFPKKFDSIGLHNFLSFGYAGPDITSIAGIIQLKPGTVLSIDINGRENVHQFWRPVRAPKIHRMEEALEVFLPLMDKVIKSQLVSDVDIGILQSGGIDSTIISLSAHKISKMDLYTAKFYDQRFDESKIASLIAKTTGSKHTIVNIDSDLDPEQTFRKINYHFDCQCADESAGPLLLLTQAISKSCRVLLAGDGGDEFFGGYKTYKATRFASRISPYLSLEFSRKLGNFFYGRNQTSSSRFPANEIVSRFFMGLGYGSHYAHTEWRRFIPHHIASYIYGPALEHTLSIPPMQNYRQALDDQLHMNIIDRALIADQSSHLQSLLYKTDSMSMANGVEIRVPFLDKRIMDFASSCDKKLLVPEFGATKPLLRKAANMLGAPAEVLYGEKKGFNSPISTLLRGSLKNLANHLIFTPGLAEPFFKPLELQALWAEHLSAKKNHAYALWPIIHFLLWRETRSIE